MSFIDILFNAAGGGILGSALHCVTDWIDTKNKIAMMKAQVDAAEKTEAWKAFAASQIGNESIQIPANTPPWASALYLCVDAVKQITRPILTWAAVVIIASVYFAADPQARAAMSQEILFGCFTATFWYYGARYSKGQAK